MDREQQRGRGFGEVERKGRKIVVRARQHSLDAFRPQHCSIVGRRSDVHRLSRIFNLVLFLSKQLRASYTR